MPDKRISEVKTFSYQQETPERLIENGLKHARTMAVFEFGIDDCGHSDKVKEWDRSSCSIEIRWVGLWASVGMGGAEHWVAFETYCAKYEEDEEC